MLLAELTALRKEVERLRGEIREARTIVDKVPRTDNIESEEDYDAWTTKAEVALGAVGFIADRAIEKE